MSKSPDKCSICNNTQPEMHQLPFKGPVCDNCISSQCTLESADDEPLTSFSIENFSVIFQDSMTTLPSAEKANIGRRMYELKQQMDEFQADVKNYKEIIRRKIELTRAEIFINYNFCKNKFAKQRNNETNDLLRYKQDLAGLLESDVIHKLKQNAAKHAENFNKINNDLYQVSEMELDNFNKTLKADLEKVNMILFSNHKITYAIPELTNFHILDLGCLKFNDCDELIANNVIKDFLETSPYFHDLAEKSNIFDVRSAHILSESMLLVCYQSFNEITLKRFHLKNSHLSYQHFFQERKPERKLFTGNNHDSFVTCASFEDGNFELVLFDEKLKAKKKITIAGNGLEPVSIHLTLDNIYVVMANDQGKLTIKRFNFYLHQNASDVELFGIQKIGNKEFDVENFSTKGLDNYIFIRQKTMLGTRVTTVDLDTNKMVWRVDLHYFFDKFYVDIDNRQIIFFCQGFTFVYDIATRKYDSSMDFDNSCHCVCEFDYFKNGEVYFLSPFE